MARKDSKGDFIGKAPSKTPRFNQTQFVNYNLNELQKAEIKSVVWTLDDVDNALVKLTEENYKVTLSYDDYSSAYACFLTPKGDKHVNAGLILSGRGSTPYKALKQAYYIHTIALDGNWADWMKNVKMSEIDD